MITKMILGACLFFNSCGDKPDKRPEGPAVEQAPETPQSPEVYNGKPSVAGEFPEVGWIGNCTATLVAPDVIFTAGHCRATGSSAKFRHRATQAEFSGKCTRHPGYDDRTTYNDYSLCKLDVAVPKGSHMSSFDIEKLPAEGEKMLVNGYGAPNLGTHFWGSAVIAEYRGQDLIGCGPANLGGGDSGGSLYKWVEDRTKGAYRTIVGVNSRRGNGCSYFNATAHPEFVKFVKDYEASMKVKICGVSRKCGAPEPLVCLKLHESIKECLVETIEAPEELMMTKDVELPSNCKERYKLLEQCLKK